MTFAAPWALLGLLALPLLWWLHRRLKRPPVLDLPSLMFLQDEAEAHALPRGRRIDAELLLALGAAIGLVLGAAGLTVHRGTTGRQVRVVVSGGVPAQATGYAARVTEVLEQLRVSMAPEDRLEVVREPPGDLDASSRPSVDALLAAARAGPAALRVVISDEAPGSETGDVAWVGVGDPQAVNVGIVAAHVEGEGEWAQVFCNVLNDADVEMEMELSVLSKEGSLVVDRKALRLAPHAARSTKLVLGQSGIFDDRLVLVLGARERTSWGDALPADDRVVLTRQPLQVFVDPALPALHRDRVRQALAASLTEDGLQLVDGTMGTSMAIVARGHVGVGDARIVLELEPVGEGDAVVHAPSGDDGVGRDPVVRDLSTAGVDWVYRAGARVPERHETVLLARGADNAWPIVLQLGARVRLAPDPLLGEPAAADGPFWPLLIDNLVALAGGGRDAGAGYRATGVLDAAASRLGRARIPFDSAVLAAAAPTVAAEVRTLRPLLTWGALALLALLWAAPWLRRRLGGGRARAPLPA